MTSLDQKAIWVASYPKSGNTWTRIFIHNLIGELEGKTEEAQDINELNAHTAWEVNASDYEQLLGKPIASATLLEIAKARSEVQRKLADNQSKPFFIKTHNSVTHLEGYPSINLDITLAAIYIIRNPLDIAVSYTNHEGFPIDDIIQYMGKSGAISSLTPTAVYEIPNSWSEHVGSWLSIATRPVHVIRYEDMLNDPERVFYGLATFLKMKPSPDQLSRAIEKSSFQSLVKQEKQKGFIERPTTSKAFFRAGKSGQWKEVLSKAQIRAIVEAHAPMMQRFGYLVPDCGRVVWRPEHH